MQPELQAFLDERCSAEERPAFAAVIEVLQQLADELAGDTNAAESPTLGFRLEAKALILEVNHPKLKKAAPLLYLWPSNAEQKSLPDSISMSFAALRDSGVPDEAVQQFVSRLAAAEFVKEGIKGWRTTTFQAQRPDRLSCILVGEGGHAKNRSSLVGAVRELATTL
jgi:hypothetical protein